MLSTDASSRYCCGPHNFTYYVEMLLWPPQFHVLRRTRYIFDPGPPPPHTHTTPTTRISSDFVTRARKLPRPKARTQRHTPHCVDRFVVCAGRCRIVLESTSIILVTRERSTSTRNAKPYVVLCFRLLTRSPCQNRPLSVVLLGIEGLPGYGAARFSLSLLSCIFGLRRGTQQRCTRHTSICAPWRQTFRRGRRHCD